MATRKTGRPRGRPRKSFKTDPDRFPAALADCLTALGVSERVALDLAVAIYTGSEVIMPDAGGISLKIRPRPGAPAAIKTKAEWLRQKRRQPDWNGPEAAAWRKAMAMAWTLAIRGARGRGATIETMIRALARQAGESAHAEAILIPAFQGKTEVPDYSRKD
jgi:hypothetical protein